MNRLPTMPMLNDRLRKAIAAERRAAARRDATPRNLGEARRMEAKGIGRLVCRGGKWTWVIAGEKGRIAA